MRKTTENVADFEHGGQQPLEAGKGKERDSPLQTPEWNEALLAPWF